MSARLLRASRNLISALVKGGPDAVRESLDQLPPSDVKMLEATYWYLHALCAAEIRQRSQVEQTP